MDVTERELKILVLDDNKSPFEIWYSSIRDAQARARIRARLTRVEAGNLGDYKTVGEGVCELRVDYGPGYRVYFAQSGHILIILLAGGVKSSQEADILAARQLWREHKDAIEEFQRDFRG